MSEAPQLPGRMALVAFLLWLALLVMAPPAHNAFWGVNAMRSVRWPVAAMLVLIAACSPLLVRITRVPRAMLAAFALLLALVLAFPAREALHLLGDTASRSGSIAAWAIEAPPRPWSEWAESLHAQPLDLVTGLLLPGLVARATRDMGLALGAMSFVLAMGWLAGTWRIARLLARGNGTEFALWVALIAWGGLLTFAGYAESAGIALVTATVWWGAMLAPIRRRRDGLLLALAWLLVVAAHRLGLVLLAPQLVRLLASPAPDDTPGARRLARAATVIAAAGVALALLLSQPAGGGQLGTDLRELLRWPEADVLRSVPSDLANLALLLAPLALVALLAGGLRATREALRDARSLAIGTAVLLLLPTAFALPLANSGLGIQRDWDLGVLLGLSCTVGGAFALAQLGAARARGALLVALPVLVLGAGGWVAMHADLRASVSRAQTMLVGSPPLGARHRSSVLFMMGGRAMQLGRMADAARLLEESWRLVPSPARGLHATSAWMQAGRLDDARRTLAAVQRRGGLNARSSADADSLTAKIGRLAGTSGSRLDSGP